MKNVPPAAKPKEDNFSGGYFQEFSFRRINYEEAIRFLQSQFVFPDDLLDQIPSKRAERGFNV